MDRDLLSSAHPRDGRRTRNWGRSALATQLAAGGSKQLAAPIARTITGARLCIGGFACYGQMELALERCETVAETSATSIEQIERWIARRRAVSRTSSSRNLEEPGAAVEALEVVEVTIDRHARRFWLSVADRFVDVSVLFVHAGAPE